MESECKHIWAPLTFLPHSLHASPECQHATSQFFRGPSDSTTLLAFSFPPPAATPAAMLNSFLSQDLRMYSVFPLSLYLHLVPAGMIPHRRKTGSGQPHSPCHPSTVPVPLRVPFYITVCHFIICLLCWDVNFPPYLSASPQCSHIACT